MAGENINNQYKYTVGGKTYTIDPAANGGYMKAYEQYKANRDAQFNATKTQLDQTLAQNNATTNANYNNSARQAYVDYMRNQRALPSRLQALGVRGGATESGLLNLYNNYGVEHAANEQQRNADLTANKNARDDAYNSAYQTYQSDLNEQEQKAIANQINEYNNELTRFSSTVAQYPTTEYGWNAYENWIKRLQASNDPLKNIKIAMVQQQQATQFPDGEPDGGDGGSGGGGGSSYGGGGGSRYGGYSGGGNNNNNNQRGETYGPYYPSVEQRAAQTVANNARRLANRYRGHGR